MDEKRKATRVYIDHSIIFKSEGKGSLKGKIENISLVGSLVSVKNSIGLAQGDEVHVDILFGQNTEDYNIHLLAKLVRIKSENELAIRFLDMDVDALAHLRQFLSLNFGDADQIALDIKGLIND